MQSNDAENVIDCPLCGLPHRSTAYRCEACDQDLHSKPRFSELRAELRERQRNMVLGGAAIVAMFVLNVALFGGAGYMVAVAPFIWAGSNWLRWRTLRAHLGRSGQLQEPQAPKA